MVLWGESSVSAVQEGEGRQETGKLFMKGRESERGGSTEEYERATLCKQQRELDGLWGRSLESTSCSPTVVLEGTQDVMSSFS